MKQQRFDARVFFDGEAALLAAFANKPDILLTNLTMLRMGGPTLASVVHKLDPDCTIIFSSANASIDRAVEVALHA